MLRIPCPFCGLRDHSEFVYGGDAAVKRPDLDNDSEADWYDYLYLRDNPRGTHKEFWQHVQGCRHWLVVRRDTASHAISDAAAAREALGGALGEEPS